MRQKKITLSQLKDAMRYVYGDLYKKTDLTNYDNWVGFTHYCEAVWNNLDKRSNRKRKAELSNSPPRYVKSIKLPIIGQLYKKED